MNSFIEESRKSTKRLYAAAIFSFLIIVVIAIYYLFLNPPPTIEEIAPSFFEEISGIQFNPETVVNSNVFRALRSYPALPTTGSVGRDNPFIGL